MVAAIPVIFAGHKSEWSHFFDHPGSRCEFPLGDDFLKINGKDVIPLFIYARWACIPFSLIGALYAYRWARELYGLTPALVTLILYVFEPNLLAHGELITPDAACTAFGILAGYTFWRWLKNPTWGRALLAGGTLGLAELSKMSWLILFGLWPLLWLIWRWLEPKQIECQWPKSGDSFEGVSASAPTERPVSVGISADSSQYSFLNWSRSLAQLTAILLLAVYLINLGYGFDGTGTPLKQFQFVSTSLTGRERPGMPDNRFRDSWFGAVPMPFPKQYTLGFDAQKKDFELFGERSYLRGEWREKGWWYYYLYGLLVKVPCGIWGLFVFVIGCRLLSKDRLVPLRDEIVLLTPAIALLSLVSSQTGFNIHLRYVFPSLGFVLIFIGQSGTFLTKSFRFRAALVSAAIVYAVVSCMLVYPNHLAYFNDFVGGPKNGHKHLLGSSLDWGQDDHKAIAWIKEHEPAASIEFSMFSITLANALWDGDQVENDTAQGEKKLILYSADYYSERETHSKQDRPTEEIVKRFDTGSVLTRVLPK